MSDKHLMGINVTTDRKAGRRYADLIVDGHKAYESRNGDTLRPYVGKRVAIVRTGEGPAKAIGEVTVGEPMVVNQKQFRGMEHHHLVPEGSSFDIKTPTKHLYPMHNPVRYEQEYDVGHGIIARKVHKAEGGSVSEPKKTVKAYKLFRVHPKHPGKLFPLFVDSNTPVAMNEWVAAKEGEMANGKVKSKLGPLAYRPGWHAGDLPIATHIGEKSHKDLKAPDRRPANHAWAEIEMPDDVDWQSEANKRGVNAKGKFIPSRAHITDQLPHEGHYRYKTNPNMTGNWLIGGAMKVNKVLTDDEVKKINEQAGAKDLPRAAPFDAKHFGFRDGGVVGPEEWVAEEHVNHHHIVHKAEGGLMDTSLAQMRMALSRQSNPKMMDSVGLNEALDMKPKMFINPNSKTQGNPDVGGVPSNASLPIGGIDANPMAQGQQMVPKAPQAQAQPQSPPGNPAPMTGSPPDGQQGGPKGNLLALTSQGQALNALKPAPMADGGLAKFKAAMMFKRDQAKHRMYAKGGKVYEETEKPKRIKFNAKGHGGVSGIVVPRHMWEGSQHAEGMEKVNAARAAVYGGEKRSPLGINQVGRIHRDTLNDHFKKPIEQQQADEQAALERLRKAKHIGRGANTLDESEKLDTVRHERDAQGRTHVGYASKGVAGHSLYTSGHGDEQEHHVINTCPGQTVGCGGGIDKSGVVDTSKGTCFAPNAESQYVNAAVRRASHEQAKHDPAMTRDWILAHTGSLRGVSNTADKKNVRTLFRPNVVDETDVSSRHAIRHLNEQRKAAGKPPIIANSYGKTTELHDPENGYYVTHSNVGPKTKHGKSIEENIGRDKQRVRSTILAADASGKNFTNEQGNKTPPKGSYMVTDVKRGSPLSKAMQEHITHAKYWSTPKPVESLSDEEKAEGEENHYNGHGKPTTPDKSHYGHTTLNGQRYDYQKQHVLHPRLVQVGKNPDGSDHMIPTDSRFKDEDFLPKNRYMTKNGKKAGHILMTTPTESTSNLAHHTSFTHHVNDNHIEYAKNHNGEYEIDPPAQQEASMGKEYVAPQEVKIAKRVVKKAMGGSIESDEGLNDDNFHAFPERNFAAQHHLAHRAGIQDITDMPHEHLHNKG
jgi:hypothetical protein